MMTRGLLSIIVFLTVLAAGIVEPAGGQSRIDPKSPDWTWFPAVDTMYSYLKEPSRSDAFGREPRSVGDVDNDSLMDFCLIHARIDYYGGGAPNELLLYHGTKGKYPESSSGERIGPSEIGSDVSLLTAGDFDGDHYRDLVVEMRIFGDTSLGNTNAGYDLFTPVVFWNDGTGHFSLDDTTHLELAGVDRWWAHDALAHDWTQDGADDLLVTSSSKGYLRGQNTTSVARVHLFRGIAGERWGRKGREHIPVWEWWTPPEFNKLGPVVDQDGDGFMDIPFCLNFSSIGTRTLSILYGTAHGLLDTTEMQTIVLDSVEGDDALLSDVTGDGMPELLITSILQGELKIYAGRPGQRLLEQYGTGHDAPEAGKGWWSRPWAVLWEAHRLSDGWTTSGPALALYDGNLDGINDIWVKSMPYILCYGAGDQLDSLIDGIIELPDIGGQEWLGDIDGSGIPTFAVFTYALRAMVLYKANPEVPIWGKYRKLPHLSAGGIEEHDGVGESTLGLVATPNPSDGVVRIRWEQVAGGEETTIVVRDILGREVASQHVSAQQGEVRWESGGAVGGAYFITLSIGEQSETTRIMIQ